MPPECGDSHASGVLVLGHPRSGTTLLRRLLGAHSRLAATPETHLFSACARFLSRDITAHGLDLGVLAGLHFAGFPSQEVVQRLRSFAYGFLDDFAARQGKPRWVEKTAFDVFHLPTISELCGDTVKYVGIIRHPLDVALSTVDFCAHAGVYPADLHAYLTRFPQPVEAFVRSWVDATENLFSLAVERPEHVVICRYEDLVADAEGVLADLFAFVGETMEAGLVERALGDRTRPGLSDHKTLASSRVHAERVGLWGQLPAHQIARLSVILKPHLEKCGYDPIEAMGELSEDEARHRYEVGLALRAAGSAPPTSG